MGKTRYKRKAGSKVKTKKTKQKGGTSHISTDTIIKMAKPSNYENSELNTRPLAIFDQLKHKYTDTPSHLCRDVNRIKTMINDQSDAINNTHLKEIIYIIKSIVDENADLKNTQLLCPFLDADEEFNSEAFQNRMFNKFASFKHYAQPYQRKRLENIQVGDAIEPSSNYYVDWRDRNIDESDKAFFLVTERTDNEIQVIFVEYEDNKIYRKGEAQKINLNAEQYNLEIYAYGQTGIKKIIYFFKDKTAFRIIRLMSEEITEIENFNKPEGGKKTRHRKHKKTMRKRRTKRK